MCLAPVVAEEEPPPAHDALPRKDAEPRQHDMLQESFTIDAPERLRFTPETDLFLHRRPTPSLLEPHAGATVDGTADGAVLRPPFGRVLYTIGARRYAFTLGHTNPERPLRDAF